jgi:hypothetical protein
LSTKTGGAACAANDNKVDTEKSKKVSNERTSDLGKGKNYENTGWGKPCVVAGAGAATPQKA